MLAPDSTTVPPPAVPPAARLPATRLPATRLPATRLPVPLTGPDSVSVPPGAALDTLSVPAFSTTALATVPLPSSVEAAPPAKVIAPLPATPPGASSSVPPFSVVPPV